MNLFVIIVTILLNFRESVSGSEEVFSYFNEVRSETCTLAYSLGEYIFDSITKGKADSDLCAKFPVQGLQALCDMLFVGSQDEVLETFKQGLCGQLYQWDLHLLSFKGIPMVERFSDILSNHLLPDCYRMDAIIWTASHPTNTVDVLEDIVEQLPEYSSTEAPVAESTTSGAPHSQTALWVVSLYDMLVYLQQYWRYFVRPTG